MGAAYLEDKTSGSRGDLKKHFHRRHLLCYPDGVPISYPHPACDKRQFYKEHLQIHAAVVHKTFLQERRLMASMSRHADEVLRKLHKRRSTPACYPCYKRKVCCEGEYVLCVAALFLIHSSFHSIIFADYPSTDSWVRRTAMSYLH